MSCFVAFCTSVGRRRAEHLRRADDRFSIQSVQECVTYINSAVTTQLAKTAIMSGIIILLENHENIKVLVILSTSNTIPTRGQ